MPLYKLADFDPNYKETFEGDDIKSLDLYTEGGTKVGAVDDVLVDDDGRFRYLVISTAFNTGAKKTLLPIGLSHIDYHAKRVSVDGLSKEQVEHLPEYRDNIVVDYNYEEHVRSAYRPAKNNASYDRNTYNYQQDANLYDLSARDNQTFKLYEERLVAKTNRIKTGEVSIGKHVETETTSVSVPLEKERVVIERTTPSSNQAVLDSGELKFQEGEVARIEIYEETPDIRKEAFVREEVRIKKVVDHETVEAQETIRREELDIDAEGNLKMHDVKTTGNERI